jgi:hypothetical protein
MKNKLAIAGGVMGAVVGFVAALLLYELLSSGNRADPIASGLFALFVVGPAGAIAGLMLGTRLAMRFSNGASTCGLAANSFKAFVAVVVLVAAAGVAYYVYAVNTATPWLNPNAANPLLLFEVRLPAGTASPVSEKEIAIELQTDQNRMPGEPRFNQFRRDGDRPVIVGDVELAFRTNWRQLEVKIAGQPDRVYRIGLSGKAPHTPELGAWQREADGSEIRYRAKWPGQE